jgi:hypothetical protein
LRRRFVGILVFLTLPGSTLYAAVDFQRDVKPILTNHCFHCHGPDAENRKAGLRLDTHDGALAKAVVPGHPEKSPLFVRVSHAKAPLRMPPPYAHKDLSPGQIQTLSAWITEGASWKEHWAFASPSRHEVPGGAAKHPIDALIAVRLAKEDLKPAPEADRARLIRRLSLDLTGLPPKPEDVDAFLQDRRPGAYERVVDRYLASPHWGEHRAHYWLDAARYGDTHGLHSDNRREIWPWRDWVIRAFNRNLPFDQFVVEQLAGDLLPNPTLDQRIATGFHRNHIATGEGGVIPEEVKTIYVKDMVDTTATVFLGLTLGCATCHDHKYDPLPQKDFYRMAAFFNNTTEVTIHGEISEPAPVLLIPQEKDELRFSQLEPELHRLRSEWGVLISKLKPGDAADKELQARRSAIHDKSQKEFKGGAFTVQVQCGYLDQHLITLATGTSGLLRWELSLESFLPVLRMEGPEIEGQIAVRGNTARVPPVSLNATEIAASWDGSGADTGITLYVNGRAILASRVAPRPLRTEANSNGIKKTLLYGWALSPLEVLEAMHSEDVLVRAAFRYPDEYRALQNKEREYRAIRLRGKLSLVMQEKDGQAKANVLRRGQYDQPEEEVEAGTPSMLPPMHPDLPRNRLGLARWIVDRENPLTARVTVNRFWQEVFGVGLVRTSDDFGATGEAPTHTELLDWLAVEFRESGWDVKKLFRLFVTSATYKQAAVTNEEKRQRDPENRLLSRGPHFRMDAEMLRDSALASSGLLDTAMGGEGVKPLQPEGVWESVAVLFSNTRFYQPDRGSALHRRSVYTFWKRAAPSPAMEILNAPTRETCVVRRERTNTPLQALVTLNDPDFFDSASSLARQAMLKSASPLAYISKRLLAREFTREETESAMKTHRRLTEYFRAHTAEARALSGNGKPDATAAAWILLTSELMNLDEALNK